MVSGLLNPSVIDNYLQSEVRTGSGRPLLSASLPRPHVSRFGVIPKRHQPGK